MANTALEQETYTLLPQMYQCLWCGGNTGTEKVDGVDTTGHPVTFYMPASRYWYSKGHPSKNQGVFCGPECAVKYHLAVKAEKANT
jgi:hypothetical protein